MTRKRTYADTTPESDIDEREFPLHLANARRYDPDAGASAGEGAKMSLLADSSMGDWSWKPERNKRFSQNCMPPYRPTPSRPYGYALEADGKYEFQQAARAAHRAAGDYQVCNLNHKGTI